MPDAVSKQFGELSEREAKIAIFCAEQAQRGASGEAFQAKVEPWLRTCFGEVIMNDRQERNHRFLEEALELVQAAGCTREVEYPALPYFSWVHS
jgi:hypothetical protein